MIARRLLLLFLGAAGGVLAGTILCLSASSMQPDNSVSTIVFTDAQIQDDFDMTVTPMDYPVQIPGTTLIAERLSAYDGPFLEDSSDREVVGVAALLVRNVGDTAILCAYVELQMLDIHYSFYAEYIPPGAQVLILDQIANRYQNTPLLSCSGWQKNITNSNEMSISVSVSDTPSGTLGVQNLTEQVLYNVSIYYKAWLSPPDVYVGGIAYVFTIPVLKPGNTEYVNPYHYAADYSKIVWVSAKHSD